MLFRIDSNVYRTHLYKAFNVVWKLINETVAGTTNIFLQK